MSLGDDTSGDEGTLTLGWGAAERVRVPTYHVPHTLSACQRTRHQKPRLMSSLLSRSIRSDATYNHTTYVAAQARRSKNGDVLPVKDGGRLETRVDKRRGLRYASVSKWAVSHGEQKRPQAR